MGEAQLLGLDVGWRPSVVSWSVMSDFVNGNKWMLHIKYDIVKL